MFDPEILERMSNGGKRRFRLFRRMQDHAWGKKRPKKKKRNPKKRKDDQK